MKKILQNINFTFINDMLLKIEKKTFERFILAFSSILFNFFQFFVIILVQNFINTESVGFLSYAFSVTAPVFMFFDIRLQFLILEDINYKKKFEEYFQIRATTCLASFVTILLLLFLLNNSFQEKILIVMIGGSKFFESLGEICIANKQRGFSLKESFYSKIYRVCTGTIITVFSIILFKDIVLCGLSLFLSSCIVFFLYENKINKFKKKKISLKKNLLYFQEKLPMGFLSIFASISSNIPRYLISYYYGMKELGKYSILSYLSMGCVLLVTSFFQPYIPKLAQAFYKKNTGIFEKKTREVFLFLVFFSAIFYIVSSLFGLKILSIFFNGNLGISSNILSIIIIGTIFQYTGLSILYTLTAANLIKHQVYFYAVDIILTSILSIILIPRYSLKGACLSYAIVSAYHFFIGATYFYIKIIFSPTIKDPTRNKSL